MTPDTPAFRRWAGTSSEMLIGSDLISHDWDQDGPFLVRGFHGTTHDFQAFSLERSTHDGQFGKVHYFTSCVMDADGNYASEDGPDLKNRLENLTERLEYDIQDDLDAAGLDEDADCDAIRARAEEMAREALIGDTPRVLELCLRLNRPFVIDASGLTDRPMFEEPFDYCDALQAVADEHDISISEVEDDPSQYEDRVYEVLDAAQDDLHEKLTQGLILGSYHLDCKTPDLPDFIVPLSEVTCNRFESLFKEDDQICHLDNEEGELVSSSLFASVIEHLGYDSIVLLNADKRFRTMNMMPGTTHIHLMPSARSQVKSLDNIGSFNPEDPNIFA
jgi:hypothetical protein